MKLEITENPGQEWDCFVARHTDIIFYSSAWGRVLREGLDAKPHCLFMGESGGIRCGMPGAILRRLGMGLFYSALPYGGYVGDPSLFERFMGQARLHLKGFDIAYVSPFLPDSDRRYPPGFAAAPEAATRIDLAAGATGPAPGRPRRSVRQSLNRASRMGLAVERSGDLESFHTAHGLYRQTMERNRAIARYPREWFAAIHRVLGRGGQASVFLVRHEGNVISATVAIESPRGYHLLHSGSSTEDLPLRANDLIVQEIIRRGLAEGKEFVDLMHSNPRDASLIRWKEKFGGRTIQLHKHRLVNSPLRHAMWEGAKMASPLLQCLWQCSRTRRS